MKNDDFIKIRGAKVHNLKNINVDIPRNKLVVITGVSGSGKSSLAFDTLYAEGQRRYVENLSVYARQFLGVIDKPEVERIEGISPAISIDQRKVAHNPRSTVGTITEIYDYLRLLFARVGKPHCPKCKKPVSRQTVNQIFKQVLNPVRDSKGRKKTQGRQISNGVKLPQKSEIFILAPATRTLEEIKRSGFVRVRIDGVIYSIDRAPRKNHNVEIVIDSLVIDKGLDPVRDSDGKKGTQNKNISNGVDKSRLRDSLEVGLRVGKGVVIVNDLIFNTLYSCKKCGVSLPELEPRLFSFNSPYGACPRCKGLGEKLEVDPKLIIPNPNLTIAEGAIRPLVRASNKALPSASSRRKQEEKTGSCFWWKLSDLADRYKFSLNQPVGTLSKKIVNTVLYGDKSFEGVIPNLETKYHKANSDWVRQEIEQYMVKKQCPQCLGKRLKPEALAVTVAGKSVDEMTKMSIDEVRVFFRTKPGSDSKVAQPIVKEILNRLQFLIDVGLGYLTLDRKTATLAGGEEQRIRLATQIGSKLTGVIYTLDEPSIGLHPRDQGRLVETLKKLRDLGNTVVVVEHDPLTIRVADWVIDVGPGAGKHGGRIIFEGTPKQLLKSKTLTGQYLSGQKKVESPSDLPLLRKVSRKETKLLIIEGAQEHNLKNINVKIPLGRFVCITGVSGSGKSSLMDDVLARALLKKFYRTKEEPGRHKKILGSEFLNKIVLVDQSPIGRTPRSNPATYTGAFSYIRELFSRTREAKVRGYSPSRFSFNLKGGRCEACEGQGQIKVEMYFLSDVYVECKDCKGKRYNKEALEIEYKGKNIAEVLEMTVEEALDFFRNVPGLSGKLKTLNEVGLSYVQLGQPAPSLSGGEAQRVKLATELSRKSTGRTLYILDEPTTGLHQDDIKKLIKVLRELVNKGNTVLTIEHNGDVIKNTDWCIDLGPEGGDKGGCIVAEGTPRKIKKNKKSYTGKYLTF